VKKWENTTEKEAGTAPIAAEIGDTTGVAALRTPIRCTASLMEAPISGAPTHPMVTGIVEPAPAAWHEAFLPRSRLALFNSRQASTMKRGA